MSRSEVQVEFPREGFDPLLLNQRQLEIHLLRLRRKRPPAVIIPIPLQPLPGTASSSATGCIGSVGNFEMRIWETTDMIHFFTDQKRA